MEQVNQNLLVFLQGSILSDRLKLGRLTSREGKFPFTGE